MPQQTYIFLGPQGCGKGTQGKLLADHLLKVDPARTVLAPSMGGMLRDLCAQPTYTASLLKPILEQGGLAAYGITVPVFGNYFITHMEGNEHIIIDGFPRQIEQIYLLDSIIDFYKRDNPTVIRIEISDDEAVKRLLLRGRSDDTQESIRKRLNWTRAAEKKLEDWFVANPRYRFVEVNGEHTIEETHALVLNAAGLA